MLWCYAAGFIPRGNGVGMFDEDAVVTKSVRARTVPVCVNTFKGFYSNKFNIRESVNFLSVLMKWV